MPEKLDKTQIIDLPEGASIQYVRDTWYVYFAYSYRIGLKRHQERDYIGKVIDGCFVPNDYYIDHRPDKKHRPLKNWTNPEKAKIEQRKAEQNEKQAKSTKEHPKDFAKNEPFDLSAGATAVLMKALYESRMVWDLGNAALGGNVALTMHCLNLALHTATTQRPTYLANPQSHAVKFIGKGCLTSQRASELYQQVGSIKGLDVNLGKARCGGVSEGDLLALDGTRVNCESENISLAEVGKKKDGTYGKQLNFSVLFNATTGHCLAYRLYSGNYPDTLTLTDFRNLWTWMGVPDTKATVIVDRGYYDGEELANLHGDGIGFICGAKVSLNAVKDVIHNQNNMFYEASSLLRNRGCYAVSSQYTVGAGKKKTELNLFVYRNPVSEMAATDELYDRLERVESEWLSGNTDALNPDDRCLYDNPTPGLPLVRDEHQITQYCYTLGYFALASNKAIDAMSCFDAYSYRNEVEIFFKQQKANGMRCARVQSEAALNGLALTTFVGTAATMNILYRMRKPTARNAKGLRNNYTVPELLKKLERVHLVHSPSGEVYLNNVTSREKQIVADLGFPGLFDSAEEIDKLLSVKYLAEHLKGH